MFHYQDKIVLSLQSGSGGRGSVHFNKTRLNPRGGPDGGKGGRGGRVIISVNHNLADFSHFKNSRILKAENGAPGDAQLKSGKKGGDITVEIPEGTFIRNLDTDEIVDGTKNLASCLIEGGMGGEGNAFFKTSVNQAPTRYQKGGPGLKKQFSFELKPLAQVALVGKVNSGKSSFFSNITNKQTKVSSYPYTTLSPVYGQIQKIKKHTLLMDLPGLSAGACFHVSKGLSFLRSLQRTKILLNFIDSSESDFQEDQKEIINELSAFDKKFPDNYFTHLSQKKCLTVFTKSDLISSELKTKLSSKKDHYILSNKTGEGLEELLIAIEENLA